MNKRLISGSISMLITYPSYLSGLNRQIPFGELNYNFGSVSSVTQTKSLIILNFIRGVITATKRDCLLVHVTDV